MSWLFLVGSCVRGEGGRARVLFMNGREEVEERKERARGWGRGESGVYARCSERALWADHAEAWGSTQWIEG